MKNFSSLILVVLVLLILAFFMFSFQVRETEKALVTRFGKPVDTKVEPGIYMRWPQPINKIHKFDSRAHLYEGIMEETTTKGGEPIIVTSYVVWDIHDPLKFLESVRDVDGARLQLKSLLRDTQNSILGQHYFSEFVNSDKEQIRLAQIEDEMLTNLKSRAQKDYGIGIRMVGIKQLGVSEKVTKDVFERMKADRKRKTEALLAQGKAEKTRIESDAEAKKTELLAVAEAQAKSIMGAGDAEAARYYKKLEADPEFAIFLRDLEALKKILQNKTTIILDAETDPIHLLKEIPDIQPKQ